MKFIFRYWALPFLNSKKRRYKKNSNARLTGRVGNPPAEVNEYSYNGKKVFLFSSNCCDQYNASDSDCNYMSYDNRDTDLFEKAKHIRIV